MPTATLLRPAPSPAATMLRQSAQPELRRLDVTETEAEIIICGTVQSWYLKQLAQETLRPIVGERRICNRVAVSKK
jgi:hypothetical protein